MTHVDFCCGVWSFVAQPCCLSFVARLYGLLLSCATICLLRVLLQLDFGVVAASCATKVYVCQQVKLQLPSQFPVEADH